MKKAEQDNYIQTKKGNYYLELAEMTIECSNKNNIDVSTLFIKVVEAIENDGNRIFKRL